MGVAFNLYLPEFNNYFPFHGRSSGVCHPSRCWADVVLPYAGERGVFRCPAMKDNRPMDDSANSWPDYGFNWYGLEYQRLIDVTDTTKLIVAGDTMNGWLLPGCGISGCCATNYAMVGNCSSIHGGFGNYVHVDGHVKAFRPNVGSTPRTGSENWKMWRMAKPSFCSCP